MKFTKIITTLAIASLVLVSCKKEEDKNLANIKTENAAPKEQKAIAAENVQTGLATKSRTIFLRPMLHF